MDMIRLSGIQLPGIDLPYIGIPGAGAFRPDPGKSIGGARPVRVLPPPEFHASLVEAWAMSGYSDAGRPECAVGVNGLDLDLTFFIYGDGEVFGGTDSDYPGCLIFGEIDLAEFHVRKPGFTLGTVIMGVADLNAPESGGWRYFFDTGPDERAYFVKSPTGVYQSNGDFSYQDGVLSVKYRPVVKVGSSLLLSQWFNKDGGWCRMALRYMALYSTALGPGDEAAEKAKLESWWKDRLMNFNG